MDNKSVDFVNVSLRIRPVLSQDSTTSSCLQVISKQPPILVVSDRSQTYCFDNIFTEEIDQQTVYEETVKPLVEYVKQGYNCTVFAYGQTGTGKTYTMGTSTQVENEKDVGLIPRVLDQFFSSYTDEESEVAIVVSFIEIYKEKVFDLLQNNKPPLTVKGFKVEGFCQKTVSNSHDARRFLEMGSKNRHTAGTKQNSNSSRSHAVFTVYCNVKHKDNETFAKMNLVDLAGCESVKKTGNQGSTFQEGVNINKGLLCIGQVMTALSTNASFIPYRQSMITTILQDSLNKKNFVSLIACINSNPEDCNETVQTLEFAHRVKKMKNKPEVSEAILQYKKENPAVFNSRLTNTPFKRPAAPIQTPCFMKRIKSVDLKAQSESQRNNTAESPKLLSSMSISLASSSVDATQQALSPVIRKYITAMESSLMNKLETVIKNTLQRPTRASLLMKEQVNESKENTPRLPWNIIQNEVSRLVRNEIVMLTAPTARATSSPIDDLLSLDKIRRTLTYDSPVLNDNIEHENFQSDLSNPKENPNADTVFKVPKLPVGKFKAQKEKHISVSSIEYPLLQRRQSLRLSLKRRTVNNNSSEESDISLETSHIQTLNKGPSVRDDAVNEASIYSSHDKRRYSVRLAEKKSNDCNESILKSVELDSINNNNSLTEFEINENQVQSKRYSLRQKVVVTTKQFSDRCSRCKNDGKRRSIRLNKKREDQALVDTDASFVDIYKTKCKATANTNLKLSVKDTLVGKKLLQIEGNYSPATAHTKHVLNVLNNGSSNQLEQLHSVGAKTAQQVLLFREMKGPLKKISDLSDIPGWHGKKFEKFVTLNFLKKELL